MIIKSIYTSVGMKELVDFSLIVVFTNEFFKKDTKAILHFFLNDRGMLNVKTSFFFREKNITDVWNNLNKEDQKRVMEDLLIGLKVYFNDGLFRWYFLRDEVLIVENGQCRFGFLNR